jgi:hypothetical protein
LYEAKASHRDVALGILEGRFAKVNETAALNLATGSMAGGLHSMQGLREAGLFCPASSLLATTVLVGIPVAGRQATPG